jgi:MFS family permease
MVITLVSSFTIKTKLKNKSKKTSDFSLIKFVKHTHNKHALYRILAIQFCYGLGQGGLLAVLINLVISLKSGGNQTLGYLASAVSLFAIAYSFIHRKYIDQSNFKERLLPASIILFILAIPLALTGNLLVIIAFRFLDSTLTTSTVIENDNTSYALLPTITAQKYKKEYFYVREVVLNLSRMISMFLIILVMKLTNDTEYLSYLFLLGTVGYFACIIIINGLYKYYLVGPCEEARLEQLQEEVSLAEISTRCSDIEAENKEQVQALAK